MLQSSIYAAMKWSMVFLLHWAAGAAAVTAGEGTGVLTLAAFNIEIFGVTKFGKPEVVNELSKVRQWEGRHRYSTLLIVLEMVS